MELYVLGHLSGEDEAYVITHLASCSRCDTRAKDIRAFVAGLRDAVFEIPPSKDEKMEKK
ncbi:MAG: zf-HC2 domain-containing protein [Bryobacteraceae bacterium]|nr:zf-HC2 domain-containing protein [Bryobacteraceae bacterium]